MKASKKALAVPLAALQLALSFSFGAYEAVAARLVERTPTKVIVTPVGATAALGASGSLSLTPSLLPLSDVSPALTPIAELPALPALDSPEVSEAFQSDGLSKDAPAEGSRDAGEALFAALRGEKLISGAASQDVSLPQISGGEGRAARLLPWRAGTQTVRAPRAVKSPLLRKPAVRVALGIAAAAGVVAALPLLAGHAAAVAAAGSLTLCVIGIPQIVKNFKSSREDKKDLAIASPLIWFAAAVLLSAVSIGQGSSMFWNAVNLAGVAESAVVVGQLNAAKRDAGAMKATVLTALAALAPVALLATGVLGLNAVFAAAMALLWVLNWPQIRQNARLFKEEGRAPKGIAPAYPALVTLGSAMHLYAALMGGDVRWALNAVIAIVTAGMVLGQIYFPRAANAALGPLVELSDRLFEGRRA